MQFEKNEEAKIMWECANEARHAPGATVLRNALVCSGLAT